MAVGSSVPERTFKIEGTRVYQEPPEIKIKEFILKDPEFEITLCIKASLRHDLKVDMGKDVFPTSLKLEIFLKDSPSESEYIAQHLEFFSIEEIQDWLWSSKLKKEISCHCNNHLLLRVISDFGLRVANLKTIIKEDLKRRQSLLETCL